MVLRRLVDTFLRRSPSTTASAVVLAQAAAESAAWCRGMDGRPLPAARNPGLLVKPSFVSTAEEKQLVACALELKKGYGFTSSEAQDVLAVGGGSPAASSSSSSSSGSDGLQVQAERVTGRPELPTQVHAPWGYGVTFDMAKVPAPLQAIAARIRDNDMLGRPTQVPHRTLLTSSECHYTPRHVDVVPPSAPRHHHQLPRTRHVQARPARGPSRGRYSLLARIVESFYIHSPSVVYRTGTTFTSWGCFPTSS